MRDKPIIASTTTTDGYGREYTLVDARLLAQAQDRIDDQVAVIAELRDLNTRLLEGAVNGDA